MKIIYIILLILSGIICSAQDEQDSIKVPTTKIIQFAQEKLFFERRDSLNTAIIKQQTIQIENYKMQTSMDSVHIYFLQEENKSLTKVIGITTKKPKWYESNWFYYLLGSGTIYISAKIVSTLK